jgi:rhodanese-related sulfurtransferase
MEYAALAVALVALILALAARSKASGLRQQVEDAQQDARRRIENVGAEVEHKLARNRSLLAQIAGGAQLDREQILEGRLWRDASQADAMALVASGGARLLDVRAPQETAGGIIAGAQVIPVGEIESRVREIKKDARPLLIYCASGSRSAAACEFLSEKGFENLLNLTGGYNAWRGPTARP